MRKLFEIFKGLQFQKRMIAAATICGNTVRTIKWMKIGCGHNSFGLGEGRR